MSSELCVATWNIAGGRTVRSDKWLDYNSEDIGYFADCVRKLNVDVLCIQESHNKVDDSLTQRLAKLTDMPYVAEAPGCPSHIDGSYKLHNAILSKVPISKSSFVRLPHPAFELRFVHNSKIAPPYDRYVLQADIGGLTVVTMHTEPLGIFDRSYEESDGAQFAHQIDTLLDKILSNPLIFAADFNMPDPTVAFPQCMEKHRLSAVPWGGQPTTPGGLHPDHILYSPEISPIEWGVEKTQTDHYLCWARVQYKEDKGKGYD